MSGFKIKISSLLLSFEFGPEKNQDQTKDLSLWKMRLQNMNSSLSELVSISKEPGFTFTDGNFEL